MALFKDSLHVKKSDDNAFDSLQNPGSITPLSAIYRCAACGREIVSEQNKPLPPQNHHQHAVGAGAIRWQMLVYAQHEGS